MIRLEINKRFAKIITILVIGLALFLFNTDLVSANTGINPQIPYSGNIIKNDGTILSDGTYRAKFLLYNVLSGGTAIYEEVRDGNTSYAGTGVSPALTVSDGRFEILLGSQNTTNFTSILNDDSLWLELQLDLNNDSVYEEVFAPRRRIGSSVYSVNSLRLVAANGGTDTDTLSLDISGNVIATSLGGNANTSIPTNLTNPADPFNRVIIANSSGQFSQVNISALSGGSSWALAGNSTTDAWNGSSGTRLGTTSAQPLVLATTNATAQDIRFFTGANGANERMRILGTGNVGIGTSNPQARLDVNGGIRVGDDTSNCTSINIGTIRYNNGGLQVCRSNSWSYLQCPTGYVRIPGSSIYGTRDFCIMKYEAKAVSVSDTLVGLTTPNTGSNTIDNNATSTTSSNGRSVASVASGFPIANISQSTASSYCSSVGASLTTNSEWMTIARNIEDQLSNWTTETESSTSIGIGGLFRGHTDNIPANALEANIDDKQGYQGTGNSGFSRERRTHILSNGEVIWDISGNVSEWTSDTIQGQDKPNNTSGNIFQEWTDISNFGNLSYNLTRPSNSSWNSTQNMGRYYAGTVTGTISYAFRRGGEWNNASNGGIFNLSLDATTSNTGSNVGFRCVVR